MREYDTDIGVNRSVGKSAGGTLGAPSLAKDGARAVTELDSVVTRMQQNIEIGARLSARLGDAVDRIYGASPEMGNEAMQPDPRTSGGQLGELQAQSAALASIFDDISRRLDRLDNFV